MSSGLSPTIQSVIEQTLRRLEKAGALVLSRYVRSEAAARFLTMDAATLADWRGQPGKGPKFRKVGGRVIYDVTDLIEWLERHPLQGGGVAVPNSYHNQHGSAASSVAADVVTL